MDKLIIAQIEEKIDYCFNNKSLLIQAFTRKSYSNEVKQQQKLTVHHNEVLEFVGDSILDYIVAIKLIADNTQISQESGLLSQINEGEYTRIKSSYTDKSNLAQAIEKLDIVKFMFVSKGDEKRNTINERSVKEDLFESIVAAVFFDCMNIEITSAVVLNMLHYTKPISIKHIKNLLQEAAVNKATVDFTVGVQTTYGFAISLLINGKAVSVGMAPSIKQAQTSAIENFYNGIVIPYLEENNLLTIDKEANLLTFFDKTYNS